MLKSQELFERHERAKRLVEARKLANFRGPKAACDEFDWPLNNYKGHEQGRNGFGIVDAKKYAKAFNVNLKWLQFGIGAPGDVDDEPTIIDEVPLIPWVSAGQLSLHEGVADLSDFPTISAVNLPDGDWVAFRVDGNSMNKISPPDSIIFANRRDRRLVSNGCYIVADETGATTYKRYRPNEKPPFQPASYDDVDPPKFEGSVTVIGRVKRSIIEM